MPPPPQNSQNRPISNGLPPTPKVHMGACFSKVSSLLKNRKISNGLPPTPKVHMGACFSKVSSLLKNRKITKIPFLVLYHFWKLLTKVNFYC